MATAASPPGSFTLTPKSSAVSSLLQLPYRVAQALLSPGSGEGLLSLLPGSVRQLLPGWDPDRDMPDMFGKVVLVTGANSGIGFQTSRLLARNNAHVVMVVRDVDKGKKAVEDIRNEFSYAKLTLMQADMASLKSVRKLADDITATETPLHVLVNNAGVLAPGPFTVTEDGFELTMATNFFGPLYLTLLLLPRLRASAPSRVVNVASFGEMFGRVHWDDLRCVRHFTTRGIVSTPGEAKSDKSYLVSLSALISSRLHGQSALRGAIAPLLAATEPKLQGRGGTYIGPNAFGLQLFGWGGFNTVPREPVNWAAKDAETCKQLYDAVRGVLDSATVAAGLGQVPVTHFQEAQAEAIAKEQQQMAAGMGGASRGLPLESTWR
ncbi:hypothetical protein VOLCADRAFT_93745 [Volvox carteri f. nagariensis]|uniref:NAD(P)-binding protein n=1 Tax=Volvox carteri f. nagariensis TaxID=3068 RepID=D8U2Y4_VOLCA|nr:uncharacterized protein VOLCADRAFT_93745 [Volvox carteri f. nagariensis]EFJ45884.1 hypothetical protein VOLCADRAFT_93745 [Volvox carteri f. nagariensis]|eukprot:XP_002952962.1 hypothetical protein VOLCADRAFT_93745 [Volvox carteri f. nagariensis]